MKAGTRGTHDRRVDEHAEREAQPELFETGHAPGDEARERRHHDQRRRSDDRPSPLEALCDGARVVAGPSHASRIRTDEEDLVVHRQPEERREEEDGDPALDCAGLLEPERARPDAPLADEHEHAVDRGNGERVQEHRLQREHERPESDDQNDRR